MEVNDKIIDNILQYDVNRETAKNLSIIIG